MTKIPHSVVNVPNVGISSGNEQVPLQSVPNQALHGVPDFVDGSGLIFSMYLERAEEEDKKMAENWKAGAEGILVFTGLFSAAVASLISVSIQDIRPNPQDTSNFYLAQIYHTVADPNQTNISSSLPASPPPFSPPNYAVWVNALWFLSLVISITCALLATLLQQWARRYLKFTQPRYSPHKRARIRAFFAEGAEKFLLPWTVEALPTLLHVSLFLFFAGLAVFLCNVNFTIFKLVLSWIGICTALYGCTTFIPIFCRDSPYYTPLTSLVWPIVTGIPYVTCGVLRWFIRSFYFRVETLRRFRGLEEGYRKLFVQGMQMTAEETALNSSSKIDTRAFLWTFDCLDEDHELERFFSGLPDFRSSRVVDDPLPRLTWEQAEKLSTALVGLFHRTFSSNLLSGSAKSRRAIICAKALDPATFPIECRQIVNRIMFNDQCRGLQTADFGRTVRGWGNSGNQGTALVAQAIVSGIVARVQQHDDSWIILASNELGIPESVVRDLAAHGDSLSLAILIHITRQQYKHYRESSWPGHRFSKVLEEASKFNVQDTLPNLQHEFCSLWNEIASEAQNRWMAFEILGPIREVYIALHRGTDAAPSRLFANPDRILFDQTPYPVCNVASHKYDYSASTSFVSPTSPDPPSSSVLAPLHVAKGPTDVPPLDNDMYIPGSFHPAHQTVTVIENPRIPVTSPDPVSVGTIRDIVTSGRTIPYAPLSSTSPRTAVAIQHNADLLTPSDAPNPSSSASANPALDNTDIPPTSPPLSSLSPMTPSDISPSYLESHRSLSVTTTPSTSPLAVPTSAPGLGAAAEVDSSPKPGLRKEKVALDPTSVNRAIHANTLATLDLPSQSPSLPSVADPDVAITSPSLRKPNAERTGDHPLSPL